MGVGPAVAWWNCAHKLFCTLTLSLSQGILGNRRICRCLSTEQESNPSVKSAGRVLGTGMNQDRNDKNEISLKEVYAVLVRRRWLLIVPFILISILTYLASYLITPIYESSTIVSIAPQFRLSGDLQRLLGLQDNYRSRASDESELRSIYNDITSSDYVSQLVDKLHIDRSPGLASQVQKLASKHPEVDPSQLALNLLQDDLRENVEVRFAAQDRVAITVQSPVPKMAQDIANTLGELFIEERAKEELSGIRNSQDFSDVQVQKYENALDKLIGERADLQQRLQQVQLDAGVGSETNRFDLQSDLDRMNSDLADAKKAQADIIAKLDRVPGLNRASLSLQPTAELTEIRNDLKQQTDGILSMSLRYPWSDQQVLNLKLRQNSLLSSIQNINRRLVDSQFKQYDDGTRDLIAQYVNSLTSVDFLTAKATKVKAALDQLTSRMSEISSHQARIAALDQEIAQATQLRNYLKSQAEGSNIQQALFQDMSSTKYRIIEPAKLGLDPVKPDRKKIAVMGLLLGLVVGAAAVILLELFDSSFKKVEDVQQILGLPVLAVTPRIELIHRLRK